MHLLDELKEETDDIVLVDTNILINIENKKCSNIDYKAINKLFSYEIKPLLTDLSFCEVMIGCKNIENYKNHFNELTSMEFLFCGNYRPLCKYLSTYDYLRIDNDIELNKFKNRIREYRNKITFTFFERLFYLYIVVSINILQRIDKYYWDEAYLLFKYNYGSKDKLVNKIIRSAFNNCVDNKEWSKELIKPLFNTILTELLKKKNPDKYIDGEVDKKLETALTSKNYSSFVQKWKTKKNPKDQYWLNKTFIINTRKIIDENDDNPIITDGICFILSQVIFNDAKYNARDMIDLYNIDFALRKNMRIHYFTNDCTHRWQHFIKIERDLRPTIEILFNE